MDFDYVTEEYKFYGLFHSTKLLILRIIFSFDISTVKQYEWNANPYLPPNMQTRWIVNIKASFTNLAKFASDVNAKITG